MRTTASTPITIPAIAPALSPRLGGLGDVVVDCDANEMVEDVPDDTGDAVSLELAEDARTCLVEFVRWETTILIPELVTLELDAVDVDVDVEIASVVDSAEVSEEPAVSDSDGSSAFESLSSLNWALYPESPSPLAILKAYVPASRSFRVTVKLLPVALPSKVQYKFKDAPSMRVQNKMITHLSAPPRPSNHWQRLS